MYKYCKQYIHTNLLHFVTHKLSLRHYVPRANLTSNPCETRNGNHTFSVLPYFVFYYNTFVRVNQAFFFYFSNFSSTKFDIKYSLISSKICLSEVLFIFKVAYPGENFNVFEYLCASLGIISVLNF